MTADSITVRVARAEELPRVTQLLLAMYEHQRQQGMMLALHAEAGDMWQRRMATQLDTNISHVFVAECDHELIGFLSAQIKRLPPHLAGTSPRVGFISEVFVESAGRRHGVGAKLVSAALAWMEELDVGSVELHVLARNPDAQAFWRQMGFRDELLQMRLLRQRG